MSSRSKKIWYLGIYADSTQPNRLHRLSAVNKMNYVCEILTGIGYGVTLVSPAWLISDTPFAFSGLKHAKGPFTDDIVYLPCLSAAGKISKALSYFSAQLILLIYCLIHFRKGDIVIGYHSPAITGPILMAKKIMGFKFAIQVEELYSSVWSSDGEKIRREKAQIAQADGYIFASTSIAEDISRGRPSAILHGVYKMQKNGAAHPIDRDAVRLIYAGEIEKTRLGAFRALDSMEFLPANYTLSIIGSGAAAAVEDLRAKIDDVNRSHHRTVATLHGEARGREFQDFLQTHDIGLNPQVVGDYMDSAVPSKISTYLVNGLAVVSSPVKSIVDSELAPMVVFSKSDAPAAMAESIAALDHGSQVDVRSIDGLHETFKQKLGELLTSI